MSPLLSRQADRDRGGLHLDGEGANLLAVASVHLVKNLAIQLDLDLLRRRRLDERRPLRMADGGACKRSHPVGDAVGVYHAELEPAVVRASVLEHLDTAEEAADVAEEDAARGSGVPGCPVHLDLRLERLRPEVLRAAPDIGDPSEAILELAVGLLDHRGVEAGAGHDREALAVEPADIELAPFSVQADRHSTPDVLRDPQVRREQVGGAGGQDRERRLRARQRVDRALDHPVAAPDEEQLGTVREGTLHLLGRELALRHLDPHRIRDPSALQLAPQLGQAAAEGLAGVRDHGDLGHRAASPDARETSTSAETAAIPMTTPPAMSSGWCIPRYMREKATNTGIRIATTQIATCALRFLIRDVSSSARPP